MKIQRITVTDENGVDHTWEGVEGHVHIHSTTKIGQPYQQRVTAVLALEPQPDVKPS